MTRRRVSSGKENVITWWQQYQNPRDFIETTSINTSSIRNNAWAQHIIMLSTRLLFHCFISRHFEKLNSLENIRFPISCTCTKFFKNIFKFIFTSIMSNSIIFLLLNWADLWRGQKWKKKRYLSIIRVLNLIIYLTWQYELITVPNGQVHCKCTIIKDILQFLTLLFKVKLILKTEKNCSFQIKKIFHHCKSCIHNRWQIARIFASILISKLDKIG